jgi:hypothetical protein
LKGTLWRRVVEELAGFHQRQMPDGVQLLALDGDSAAALGGALFARVNL